IGTSGGGIVHAHQGRADVFRVSNGLSGDFVSTIFEDREGVIWVATNGGLDRFRDFAIVTLSVGQGLFQSAVGSVLADKDGGVWITDVLLQRLNNGKIATYAKSDRNLSGHMPHSLFQDRHGRIWVATLAGFGYLENGKYIPIPGI